MAEKKTKIIWEENSFSEPSLDAINGSGEDSVFVSPPAEIESPEKRSLKLKAELLEIKNSLKQSLRDSYDLEFIPEKYTVFSRYINCV